MSTSRKTNAAGRSWVPAALLGIGMIAIVGATLAVGLRVIRGKPAQAPAESRAGVRPVEPRFVCMANDRLFPKEQIHVAFKGRSYYGCCDACKLNLRRDPALRTAMDPVSGRSVDKAIAVIGALADGSVRYFETEATLSAFAERMSLARADD